MGLFDLDKIRKKIKEDYNPDSNTADDNKDSENVAKNVNISEEDAEKELQDIRSPKSVFSQIEEDQKTFGDKIKDAANEAALAQKVEHDPYNAKNIVFALMSGIKNPNAPQIPHNEEMVQKGKKIAAKIVMKKMFHKKEKEKDQEKDQEDEK